MKLVDILARELKVWPPHLPSLWVVNGNTIYGESGGFSHEMSGGWPIPEDHKTAVVTQGQWQAAVDALKSEVHPTESMALHHQEVGRITRQWNGDGLPPVGTVCEFAGGTHCPEDPFDKDLKEGDEVTIIAHFRDGESELAAFTFNPRNLSRGNACVEQGMHGCFRPIRTPEQIVADQYEEDAAEIAKILSDLKDADEIFIAKTLLDCGYRKFEIVES